VGRLGTHAHPPGGEVAIEPEVAAEELDLRGEVCPYTFLKARLALEAISPGMVLRVVVDNAASAHDVPRSLAAAGHAVLGVTAAGGTWAILTRRGQG
jgi:tRNA 2-thiouridine synthesizing protein A